MKNTKQWFVTAFILIFLISAAACFAQSPEAASSDEEKLQKAREYFSSGNASLAQGDYAAANAAFKNAQQVLGGGSPVPADVPEKEASSTFGPLQSCLAQAEEADKKGDYRTAVSFYQKATQYAPRNADIYYNVGVEFLKINQVKEAAEAFKYVIKLNPRDKEAYFNLGILYDRYLDDKQQAREYYLQYITLAPQADDAELVRAYVSSIEGQTGKK